MCSSFPFFISIYLYSFIVQQIHHLWSVLPFSLSMFIFFISVAKSTTQKKKKIHLCFLGFEESEKTVRVNRQPTKPIPKLTVSLNGRKWVIYSHPRFAFGLRFFTRNPTKPTVCPALVQSMYTWVKDYI